MNIFFVGFMGCGKTFWAKKLAYQLSIPAKDLDEVIVEGENKSIQTLFDEVGENGFRQIESYYLKKILESNFEGIISCGGGTPCFNEQMAMMKNNGIVFYLKEDFDVLFDRIHENKINRPLLANKSDIQLRAYLFELFQTRETCYLESDKILIMNQINESTFAEILIKYV